MFPIKAILFFASLIGLVITIYTSLIRDKNKEVVGINIIKPIIMAGVFLLLNFIILPAFGQVGAGDRGVVLRFGAVTGKVLNEGLYFVTPFVESVEMMNVQTHVESWEASGASRDLQDVATKVSVNYHVDDSTDGVAFVYRHLRRDYVQRVIVPAIREAVKSTTAQFDAERLIVERPQVKTGIENYLRNALEKYRIIVDGVMITDFAFSESFTNAIEAKVTATQQALKAKNDLERVKMEAEQRVAQAQAEAKAIQIQAQAIQSQGGKEYVALKAIEKWKGDVPQWVGTGNAIPFVNISPPTAK